MSSLLTNALETLLSPISVSKPSGRSVRYEPIYDQIREAMREDRDQHAQGLWEREPRKANWQLAANLCETALRDSSKDLQIAGWLCQCLYRRFGLTGLIVGGGLYADLMQSFWTDIHPQIEDGDIEMRLGPIVWLIQQTLIWLQESQEEAASFSDARYLALSELAQIFDRMECFLLSVISDATPSFSALKADIQRQTVVNLSSRRSAGCAPEENEGYLSIKGSGIRVNSRHEAYLALASIGRYLATVEPHSPVPAILSVLATWEVDSFIDLVERMPEGNKSLYELIGFFKIAT